MSAIDVLARHARVLAAYDDDAARVAYIRRALGCSEGDAREALATHKAQNLADFMARQKARLPVAAPPPPVLSVPGAGQSRLDVIAMMGRRHRPEDEAVILPVLMAACRVAGLSARQLLGPGSAHNGAYARWAAMAVLQARLPQLGPSALARLFNRDHASVLHGLDRCRHAHPGTRLAAAMSALADELDARAVAA